MTVFYSERGRAYHYYRDCHQLKRCPLDSLQTGTEDEIDRPLCYDCQTRQTLAERTL